MSDYESEEDLDEGDLETDDVFNPKTKYSRLELEEWADKLLYEDANRELCRVCKEEAKEDDPHALPYGEETGNVEWKPQYTKDDEPILDDEGELLYVAFPEFVCQEGHRWYQGEGPRRDWKGKNPILTEAHLYNRKRREIHASEGVVDPAFTLDRWGKRPIQGLYQRSHPAGRKTNTPEQRRSSGSGFYK